VELPTHNNDNNNNQTQTQTQFTKADRQIIANSPKYTRKYMHETHTLYYNIENIILYV